MVVSDIFKICILPLIIISALLHDGRSNRDTPYYFYNSLYLHYRPKFNYSSDVNVSLTKYQTLKEIVYLPNQPIHNNKTRSS